MLDIIIDLAQIFRGADKQLYMVGGAVRDLLLHRSAAPDIDLATNARPDEIKRLVAQTHPLAIITVGEQFGTVRIHYAARSQHAPAEGTETTEGRGEVGAAGETHAEGKPPAGTHSDERGTSVRMPAETPATAATAAVTSALAASASPAPTALIVEAPEGVEIVEITTYRSDVYSRDSRKPEVTFGDTLEGDLLRRDFTINAMARDPLSGEILDPFGGRTDLAARLIRAVGNDPEHRFDEDPLRMLRACRFAAQLDFEIELRTARAIQRQAGTLAKISRERIRDEFTKLLVSPNPMRGIRLAVKLGLMPFIVPEVLELQGVSQAPAHSKDVYEHVLRVVQRTPPRAAARWSGLLHDIAKPRTKSVEDGKVHFFGHEDVGANMAREILRRLKFDRPFIDHVAMLVKMHMRANAYTPEWTDGAVRRLMLEANGALQDLLALSRADITSYRPDKVSRAEARVDELDARCAWLREEAERVPLKSPLDGIELMQLFARPPGAWIRPVKDYLLDLVIDGKLAPDDKAAATVEAHRRMAELEASGEITSAAAAGAPAAVRPTDSPGATTTEQPDPTSPASSTNSRQSSRATGAKPRPRRPEANPAPRQEAHQEAKRAARAAAKRQSRTALSSTAPEPARAEGTREPAANGDHAAGGEGSTSAPDAP